MKKLTDKEKYLVTQHILDITGTGSVLELVEIHESVISATGIKPTLKTAYRILKNFKIPFRISRQNVGKVLKEDARILADIIYNYNFPEILPDNVNLLVEKYRTKEEEE